MSSLLIALALTLSADGSRFYLSTDRVFAPGQQVTVNVEAQGLSSLQLRLYKLKDPAAWLDQQTDLHRPRVEHEPPRPRTWSLLSRGFRNGLTHVSGELRGSLGRTGRAALRETFPAWHETARAGASAVTPESTLPPLKEHALVDAWEQPIAASEGWAYDTIPLAITDVGVYLLEASSGGAVGTTLVIVTDVALVTKQSADDLVVWAVDPASGAARAGVKVTVKRDGTSVGEATTAADGLARFKPELSERLVIYGQSAASFTLVDPRFFASNLPEPRVYLFTERPVYRPGQEVFWKGFARKIEGGKYLPIGAGTVEVEVLDPEGNVWTTSEAEVSDRGGVDGSFMLPVEPPLGNWQIVTTIDGQRHAGQFKVMAFVKPEVRLTVRANSKAVTAGERLAGDIVGQYFFGAPYPGAEVKITLSRTRFYVPWWVDVDYRWYYSDAEYRNTAREVLEESKCTLDDKGECPFAFDTQVAGLDHTYVVEAAALDPAGRTVTGQAQITVTTGKFRLAIEPGPLVVAPGVARPVTVRAVDYAGLPVAKTKIALVVQAQRVKGDDVETVEVLSTSALTDAEGRARFTVDPSRGGYYTLKASATDDAGHAVNEETFVFASDGKGDLPFAPSDVEIVTDKQSYFAGEKALVLILAPAPESRVLFTVEGNALHQVEVLTTHRHAVLTEVTIGAAQTPNFYLGAVAVAGGQVFTKQRSVIVPPRESILKVEVAPEKDVALPGETLDFTVIVTDHTGKAVPEAEVVLGVVDEAIYAISPEIAVPLESFYYPRKRNDVRTHESVSFRFFGTSKGTETAQRWNGEGEVRYGSLKPQLDDVRKVFKDTAGWSPSGVTDASGKVRVKVTLPDNLTAWRATARVMTKNARVGSGTGSVKARKPLMLTVALPPRMVEGDQGEGALVVQNFAGKSLDLGLVWAAHPPVGTIDPTPSGLRVVGLPKTVKIGDGETQRLRFTYTASGSGDLSLRAKISGEGFEDGVESIIPIEEWAVARRIVGKGRTSKAAAVATHVLTVPDGAKPEESRLEIELVSSPIAAIRGALPYLAEFPYGCTEQTMSRFVPLVAAKGAIDQLGLDAGLLARTMPAMLDAGLGRLSLLQHEDGGWGWWESDASDVWMTAWVLDGLAEAKKWGIGSDEKLVAKGVAALDRLLAQGDKDPATRAFAALALARHGHAPAGMIQAVAEESRPATLSYLAMAASYAKKDEVAKAAITRLQSRAIRTPDGLAHWGDSVAKDAADDEVEATSLAVLAMVSVGGADADVKAAAAWLLAQFEDERFGTTRQTALAVRALAESLATEPDGSSTITVLADGKVVAKETFDAKRKGEPTIKLHPKVAFTSRTVNVEVRHEGDGNVLHAIGMVAPVRARVLAATSNGGLAVKRSFHVLGGSVGAFEMGKTSARYAPGDTVLVKLEINAAKAVSHVMVEDPRPAGLSPVSSDAGLRIEGVDLKPVGVRRELRDDRTAFFVTQLPKGKTTLYYLARAGLGGEYHALPARAESMYLPNTHQGQSTSAEIEIRAR